MADDTDDKTEDPTQKRLDDAHAKGDVVKSQEVNTWFIIAGATLILSTFSGSIGGGILTPLRNLIANAGQLRADGAALLALGNTLGYAVLGAIGVPLLMLAIAAIAGNMIQHRLVWSSESLTPKFSKVSPGAGLKRIFGKQAVANFAKGVFKLIALGAVMMAVLWPERHRLESFLMFDPFGDPRRHHQSDTAIDGRGGGDAGRGRDRRLLLPVPAMVPAAEDVAAGDQGRVQAVRRRPPHQGQDPAVAPAAHEEAHDGRRSQRQRDHHQPDPLFGRAVLRARHVGADLRRQGRRQHRAQDQGNRQKHDIPIVENVPLARALYATVDIDEEIPVEHYQAVAEIIGYVMGLKNGLAGRRM
jgi:flagellar biosynthetic protein FlhB